MKLKTLFKDIAVEAIKGSKDVEITGISSNSQCVAPGHLFIAKKGSSGEGHKFILEALEAGASAILTDIYNPFLTKVVQVISPHVAQLEGLVASHYYQNPSHNLLTVGITGTSGKTTTGFLVKHLLDSISVPCGLIGTIEYIVGAMRYKASLTTPDVISNHRLLREMLSNGCKGAVMEVSSHALEQGRVACIEYDAVIFTNLSQDHLDYHVTMEAYAKAKAKLFSSMSALPKKKGGLQKVAIVNKDHEAHKIMIENCPVPVITYGFSEGSDVRAFDIVLGAEKTTFSIAYKEEVVSFTWNLIGRFNISNCLSVVALGLSLGISLTRLSQIMALSPAIPGRLERVANDLGLSIYVDYSHKGDALKNVLETLNELKTGNIITVFGCGGNRDKGKRPQMARVAEDLSDIVIVTSDNPRDEDPMEIIREICTGFTQHKHLIEVDRRLAIEKAVQMGKPGDMILLAGKGHEPYQIFAHKTIEFDDRLVAAESCALGIRT